MLFSVLILLLALAEKSADYPAAQLLVEPAVFVKADRSKTILLDVRPAKEYAAGHIPGAIAVNVGEWSKAVNAGEDATAWAKRLGALGIDGKQPIVVYGNERLPETARAWWILRYCGLSRVQVLNGGWKGWLDVKGESSKEEPKIVATTPTVKLQPERLATREQLLAELKKGSPGQLLDVRTEGEHCGTATTAKRNGHIPEAKHLEWVETVDPKTGRFKSAPELTKLFQKAGFDPEKPTTTYCQSGGRASVMAFVVELMGGKPVRNYYRSWSEWATMPRRR